MILSINMLFLLVVVLSLDAFTAGLSYGTAKVSVPLLSVFIIALLSGAMLTLSLLAGNYLLALIPTGLTKTISFMVLFLLSLYKFYDTLPILHRRDSQLTTGNISERVNKKDKAVLSGREAALLAVALSIDNISAGLCTGTVSLPFITLLIFTSVIHFIAIQTGLMTGRLLLSKTSHNFTWLGACILMLLAFLRLA